MASESVYSSSPPSLQLARFSFALSFLTSHDLEIKQCYCYVDDDTSVDRYKIATFFSQDYYVTLIQSSFWISG